MKRRFTATRRDGVPLPPPTSAVQAYWDDVLASYGYGLKPKPTDALARPSRLRPEEIEALRAARTATPSISAARESEPRKYRTALALTPAEARRWFETRLGEVIGAPRVVLQRFAAILARGYGRDGFISWRKADDLHALVESLTARDRARFDRLEETALARAWQAYQRDRREREVSEWVFPLRETWQPCWRSHWLPEALPPITDRELRFRISRNPRRAARVTERARLLSLLVNDANCLDARVQAALAWKCRDWLVGPPALKALQPLTRARAAAFFGVSENQIRGALDFIARRYPPK